jgi:hypothetical protein
MTEQQTLNETTIPALGTFVEYTDSSGHTKPALVLGGPDSDDRLPELADGELHLYILSGTGSHDVRLNVPRDDEGHLRTWRPIL